MLNQISRFVVLQFQISSCTNKPDFEICCSPISGFLPTATNSSASSCSDVLHADVQLDDLSDSSTSALDDVPSHITHTASHQICQFEIDFASSEFEIDFATCEPEHYYLNLKSIRLLLDSIITSGCCLNCLIPSEWVKIGAAAYFKC
ncbi:hypothetical protein LXL04_020694 [Taraxacum kok-saghyz]